MLRKLTLGLVVLALLTGCAGLVLPETLSEASPEEVAPLSDRQALAEFQLETSGDIGVGVEPAVPAPVEDTVNITDRQDLAEFQLETSGDIGVGVEPAVPAPVEEIAPETDGRLIKDRLELEAMQTGGAGLVREVAPATVPDSLLETNPVYYEWLLENK